MSEINFTKIVNKLLEHNTQKELCDKTGVSQSIISDLKRGEPRPNISYKIGRALEKALAELEESTNV